MDDKEKYMSIPTIPPLSLFLIMLGIVLLMAAIIVRRRLKRALPAPTRIALKQPVDTEDNQTVPLLDAYAEQQEKVAVGAGRVH